MTQQLDTGSMLQAATRTEYGIMWTIFAILLFCNIDVEYLLAHYLLEYY